MILTCPACATSYFAPDEAIGAAGRRVRCQSCGNTWRAQSEEPLELTDQAGVASLAPAAEFGRRDDTPETLAETPAPELPKAFRARAEQQRRLRRAAAHGAVWAGLASVFIGLIAAGWLFRVEVVEMYPRAAAAYAMVGSPVNPTGLEFEAVNARVSPVSPEQVLVSGALRNVRDREIVAPPVRVALLDAKRHEIGHAVVRIDAAPVLPGKVQGFAAMIDDPDGKAAGVGVDFAPTEVAPAPPKPHAARAVRHPPAADAAGLRPAISPDALPVMTPIDAEPIEAQPIDNAPSQAVSASDHG
jgi:predicted Zn finger-like uncharacterized protein